MSRCSIEMSMTGLPGLEEMRSLNKANLSLIADGLRRRPTSTSRASWSSTGRGGQAHAGRRGACAGPFPRAWAKIYVRWSRRRRQPRTATEKQSERRIAQDWVVRPLLRSIPGVAEINSQGGYVRQYQALVNPERMRHYEVNIQQVYQALARNMRADRGGSVLPHYAEQYLIRSVGLAKGVDDIGSIVPKGSTARRSPLHRCGASEGHRPRGAGRAGQERPDRGRGRHRDLMMRGGNAKEVVSRGENPRGRDQRARHAARQAADRAVLRP